MTRHEQSAHAWAIICPDRGALGVYCFQSEKNDQSNAGCVKAVFPTRKEARAAQHGKYYPARIAKVRIVLEEI